MQTQQLKHNRFSKIKNTPQSGFTLIELLVVIAIIAILASILTIAGRGVVRSANSAKAKTLMKNIGVAIQSFSEDHYGQLPIPATVAGTDPDVSYDSAAAAPNAGTIVHILANFEDGVSKAGLPGDWAFYEINPKGQTYLRDVNIVDDEIGGFDRDDGNLYDPYGEKYGIALDTNGDGSVDLGVVETGIDTTGLDGNSLSSVMWSLGDNKLPGHSPDGSGGDITSWNTGLTK